MEIVTNKEKNYKKKKRISQEQKELFRLYTFFTTFEMLAFGKKREDCIDFP